MNRLNQTEPATFSIFAVLGFSLYFTAIIDHTLDVFDCHILDINIKANMLA
jgi:hypothetical protein